MSKERDNQEIYEDEEEIDLKEIFATLKRFYKSILAVTMFALLSALIYAYFATNIYQSTMMVKLSSDNKAVGNEFMAMAMGQGNSSLEDEATVFQTRLLAKKALENLNLGIRYFTTENLKTQELYKYSPFVVTYEYLSPQIMGRKIRLVPAQKGYYRLVIEPTAGEKAVNALRSLFSPLPKDEQPIVYNELHAFGESVTTSWFTLTVGQLYEMNNEYYEFSMVPNDLMADFIRNELTVSPNAKDGTILVLSVEDNVALRARDILNALSNAYIQDNLQIKSESADKKLEFIDIQLEAIDKALKGSAENLEQYKATNVVVDLSAKAQLTAGKLSELESQLYEINMRIDVMENVLGYIKEHHDLEGINVGSGQQINPAIESIVQEIQRVTSMRSDMLADYTEAHPDVVKLNRQLISLRSSLQEAIRSSLRSLKKRKQSLSGIIAENTREMQTLPEQERKLARLTRNFMVNEKIYSFLLEKRAETAIVESSTVSETRIIETPAVELLPVKPKRALIVVLGFVLGMILGIAQAMLRAYLDNTIKRVEDIEKLTSIPIYGAVPLVDSKSGVQHYHEALRVIWTNLEFSQTGDHSKLVTVTSSVSGEGKSTVVTDLAKTIAKSGKKALILDLDMRRSTLHEKLSLSNEYGMSTLLSGKSTPEESIQHTKIKNFHVVTAGPIPPNPTALIMASALPELIETVSKEYDYIILDSPPIGLVADAMALMRMSDISLIVLKANYSKKDFVKNINRFTGDENINAGIILNGIPFGKNYAYGYGYGYGYSMKGANDYYSANA